MNHLLRSSTTQKMKFSIKDFFSKCDQIRWKLRIWSHLLKKFIMENFIFYAVFVLTFAFVLDRGSKKCLILRRVLLLFLAGNLKHYLDLLCRPQKHEGWLFGYSLLLVINTLLIVYFVSTVLYRIYKTSCINFSSYCVKASLFCEYSVSL